MKGNWILIIITIVLRFLGSKELIKGRPYSKKRNTYSANLVYGSIRLEKNTRIQEQNAADCHSLILDVQRLVSYSDILDSGPDFRTICDVSIFCWLDKLLIYLAKHD